MYKENCKKINHKQKIWYVIWISLRKIFSSIVLQNDRNITAVCRILYLILLTYLYLRYKHLVFRRLFIFTSV